MSFIYILLQDKIILLFLILCFTIHFIFWQLQNHLNKENTCLVKLKLFIKPSFSQSIRTKSLLYPKVPPSKGNQRGSCCGHLSTCI